MWYTTAITDPGLEEACDEMSLLCVSGEQGGGIPGPRMRGQHPPAGGECLSCHKRFTTSRNDGEPPLVVVKRREPPGFDRNKVMSGLIRL